MSGSTSLPASVALRDVMLTLVYWRRRMLVVMALVLAATVLIVLQIERRYEAKSTVLVLIGSEYNFRPAAGQQMSNANGVEYEQILRTEADILGSDELYRSVIQTVGIGRLYPKLLNPPGPVARFFAEAKAYIDGLAQGSVFGGEPARPVDLMSQAVRMFASNFAVAVDRKSAIIRLTFRHPNPEIAAEVLKVLETRYFALRARLFDDTQASIVEAQQSVVGARLAAADLDLATFKRDHDIASFSERQKILLAQQGRLEEERAKNESAISGLQARTPELTQQLRAASGQTAAKGTPNAAAPMQSVIETYRRHENDAQTTYRGSPAVDNARTEMMKNQSELGKLQSRQAFNIAQDLNKAQADMASALATRETIAKQLAGVNTGLDAIDADESHLHELERARAVLEDQYRAVAKILDERRVVEAVSLHRQSSVRIVEPPAVPAMALPTRRLILLAGALIAVIAGLLSVLIPGLLRGVYLRFEALEVDTGLPVLATLPETKALAKPVVLVTPS